MYNFDSILNAFSLSEQSTVIPLGNGLINSTYLVTTPSGQQYVLQHINTGIFTNVAMLQDNIERVTNHLRVKLTAAGVDDIDRHCLRFLPCSNTGNTFFKDNDDNYWRLMLYIPDSVTKEQVTPQSAEEAGRAFGQFEKMLADMDPQPAETIKDFHNMEFRLSQLKEAIERNPLNRVEGISDLINDILGDEERATRIDKLQHEGKLPVRVCHCDTKVNNMLFDKNGDFLCVIDLDTVMPGNVLSDYGDFLRTAANCAVEDEPDVSKIKINMDVYHAFTRGYLAGAGDFLTDTEKAILPQGMYRFAYMQAVRFLTDYINGDTYYKIQYPEHNLVRASAQWQLAQLAKELS